MKKEVEKWKSNFEKKNPDLAEEIVIEYVSGSSNKCELSIKFENEDRGHKFDLERDGKDATSTFLFSTTDIELKDWVVHVQQFALKKKRKLDEILNECAQHYFDLENEDTDEMGGGEDDYGYDEDDVFTDSPSAPVSISNPDKHREDSNRPKKSATDFFTGDGSKTATQRLIKDLNALDPDRTKQFGYSVGVIDNNLYHWKAELFDFDGDLAADMKKAKEQFILLDIKFPKDFPFSPPFVRVVRPRMAFHTGHVTIGGSICMELLTRSGWLASYSIESIIVQIRTEMMIGNARLDKSNKNPYSESEAKAAFERVARQHGWQ